MTIKDIARLSGVGVSTVSRVLNDRPDVSEESRRRVLQVIAEYNYLPNNSARSLVRTKSDAVGLVCAVCRTPSIPALSVPLSGIWMRRIVPWSCGRLAPARTRSSAAP